MMARLRVVKDLREAPLVLSCPRPGSSRRPAGDQLRLMVTLTNTGTRPMGWTADAVLNLAYRWVDSTGRCVEANGRRTSLPLPLVAGEARAISMLVQPPAHLGSYELIGSLVLEGVHWACDVSKSGWFRTTIDFAAPPTWPDGLDESRGARALRGAFAAAALQRQMELLEFGPNQRKKIATANAEPSHQSSAAEAPSRVRLPRASVTARLRTRLRKLLGLVEMRTALEDLQGRTLELATELRFLRSEIESLASRQDHQLREIKDALMYLQLSDRERVFADPAKLNMRGERQITSDASRERS